MNEETYKLKMGIGGDLILTAAAREIKKKLKKKIFILKKNNLLRKNVNYENSLIFYNNPNFSEIYTGNEILIDRSKKKFSYASKLNKKKFFWKNNNVHAVNIICNHFNITADSISPELFFDKQEILWFENFKKLLPSKYIVIEPFGKTDYTFNRLWFKSSWRKVLEDITAKNSVIQIGNKNKHKFKNVIDLTSKLNIRQAALVIKNSKLFVGTIGGLMHLAKAANTKSIILHSGFEPLGMCSYMDNHNINFQIECMPCGLRTKCNSNYECMKLITPEIVIKAIKNELD